MGALDEKYLKTNTNLDFFEAMGVAAKNVRHGEAEKEGGAGCALVVFVDGRGLVGVEVY